MNRLGHLRIINLLPIFFDDGAFVFTKFFANRIHLPAQKILALLLLCAGLHLVSNALAYVQFRQPLLLEPQRQLQTVDDIQCFKQFDLLCEI